MTDLTQEALIESLKQKLRERDVLIMAQCELISDLSRKLESDNLTGTFNRIGTTHRLESMISQQSRLGNCVFAAFIDIDDFKNINDTWGHAAGDLVLQTVADRLRASTRLHDVVGRWAGDEFVIAFSLTKTEVERGYHMIIANRVTNSIRDNAVTFEGQEIKIAVSIGIAGYCGTEHISAAALVALADSKMYDAKQLGKNSLTSQIEFTTEQLKEST
jgi:diguanylate cyclase (GGDEF)-like protein